MFCHYKNCSYEELLTMMSLIEEELTMRDIQDRDELHQEILREKDNEYE